MKKIRHMINCRWLNNISPLKFAQLILVKIAVMVLLLGLILKKKESNTKISEKYLVMVIAKKASKE